MPYTFTILVLCLTAVILSSGTTETKSPSDFAGASDVLSIQFIDSLYREGVQSYKERSYAQALSQFRDVLQLDIEHEEAYRRIVQLCIETEELDWVTEYFDSLAQSHPGSAYPHLGLGLCRFS